MSHGHEISPSVIVQRVFTLQTCPGGSLESSISEDHTEQVPVLAELHGSHCQLFPAPAGLSQLWAGAVFIAQK